MRNRNERNGALLDALTVQVGHAVFGHHVMNIATRGDHPGAGLQAATNARDGSVFGRGGQGDDRFAAVRTGRAPVEVDLAADAGVEAVAK